MALFVEKKMGGGHDFQVPQGHSEAVAMVPP